MDPVPNVSHRALPGAVRLDPDEKATLFVALRQAASLYRGEAAAIEDASGSLTLEDLLRKSLGMARIATRLVRRNEVIGILLPT